MTFFPAEITAVSFDRAALLRYKLYDNGFHPLPVSGKAPVACWPEKIDDEKLICLAETRTTSTGIDAKFTPAININIWDGPAAQAVEELAREHFGEHGNIYVRFGSPGDGPPGLAHRRLILLRTDEPFKKLSRAFIAPNDDEYIIEIFGDGEQYVVDGTVDGSIPEPPLRLYHWTGGELATIKREDLPYVRREDMERFLDAAAKLLNEQFNFVLKTAEVELEWLRRFVAQAQAELAKRKAANPEPTPQTLQQIREVIIELKEHDKKPNLTVNAVIDFLDRNHFHLIRDWRGPFVDGARPRLRQAIGPICAEFGIGEVSREELEARIPADTLAALKDPSKDGRAQRFWNIMMVLKARGFTVDGSLALFEKYPKGIAAGYRGRLRHEIQRAFDKIRIEVPPTTKDEVPPADPVGPPLPIDETIKVFQRWLLLKDHTPVYAVLGTIAANYLEGDPVWLGVIGPPSSAKTEILNATSMLPHVVQAATLTVAGLLSGTPRRQQTAGAKGGLLQQIGDFGIIVLKDLGSILSMHTETRAEVLAALREIYDGAWTRHIGSDGGRTLSWKGKVGLVFAATEVIDSHYAVMGAMGDRFLLSRFAPTPGQPQFKRALAHLGGTTKQMRKELAEAVAKLFAGRRPQPPLISNEEANCIGEVISLAVRLRGAVERDRRTSEIVAIYGAEGTARIGLALERLLAGLNTLGLARNKALEVVKAVALDSVPPLRRRAYECVAKYSERLDPVETADVAIELGLPTNTARRILEELAAHGLVIRRSQGPGKADLWDRADWEAEDKKAEEELNSRSPKEDEEPNRSGV